MCRRVLLLTMAALIGGLLPTIASAATFTGAGLSPERSSPVSAKAEFSISGDILTLILTNTTIGGTGAQGDALTGVVFDLTKNPLPSLTLASIGLTADSNIYADIVTTQIIGYTKAIEAKPARGNKPATPAVPPQPIYGEVHTTGINNATPLNGSWTDKLESSAAPEFGVATTGFSGLFQGGSISRGNASPDYAIIAGAGPDGTGDMRTDFGGSKLPQILNSLTFTFSGASGLLETQITNVGFLFGTDGGNLIPGLLPPPPPPPDDTNHGTGDPVPAPEPSSLIVFATLFAMAGGYGRFRRRTP